MVPKLHAKGRSFRGAAAYLLHDKGRAKSSERVAWTETRNLASDNPEHAWKIMAATAMDQARLKRQAGIKNTGRKSNDAVLHMTLSWHPDEKPGLSRDEMMKAALGAVRALRADDRQVMFVCHNDEPQPHLHVMLNRVSPADGRMLSSSKEKLALSRWAEAYEKERGAILCEERVINNAARKRGEFVRSDTDMPRHIFELEAANDDRPDAATVRENQRHEDAEVARRNRDVQSRQAQAWAALFERHQTARTEIRRQAKVAIEAARKQVRENLRDDWRKLHRDQAEAVQRFTRNESNLIGRVKNAFRAINFGAIMRSPEPKRAIGEAFDVLASRGARLEAVRREQERERSSLDRRQRADEQRRAREIRIERDHLLREERLRFIAERSDRLLADTMNGAASRANWRTRNTDRRRAWEERPDRDRGRSETIPTTRRAAEPTTHRQQAPQPGADQERLIAEQAERLRKKRQERSSGKDRDKGPDR